MFKNKVYQVEHDLSPLCPVFDYIKVEQGVCQAAKSQLLLELY